MLKTKQTKIILIQEITFATLCCQIYVNQWCTSDFGRKEAVLWDLTRVDCLAKDYAIEFDFAKKWAEAVGQSLYYSKMTGKAPAIALILTNITDYKYLKRIERLDNDIKVFLIKAY